MVSAGSPHRCFASTGDLLHLCHALGMSFTLSFRTSYGRIKRRRMSPDHGLAAMAFVWSVQAQAAEVTWQKDIKPLFDKQCASCHGTDAPEHEEFSKDKKKWTDKSTGMRMDTHSHLITHVGWPYTGADGSWGSHAGAAFATGDLYLPCPVLSCPSQHRSLYAQNGTNRLFRLKMRSNRNQPHWVDFQMECPVCTTNDLVMSDRQGIEIDYCPQCRGVWLDRGELDKIVEHSAPRNLSPQPQPHYAPQPNVTIPSHGPGHGRGNSHGQKRTGKNPSWKSSLTDSVARSWRTRTFRSGLFRQSLSGQSAPPLQLSIGSRQQLVIPLSWHRQLNRHSY